MSFDQKLEDQILTQEKKLQELIIRMESLDRDLEELFSDLKATPQQITQYLGDKDNFTEEDWQELHKQRKLLEEKLQRELDNIRNPLKAKKAYEERNVGRHWLFVR